MTGINTRVERHPITMEKAIGILSDFADRGVTIFDEDFKAALRMAIKSLIADKLNIERTP
ncbi:hypothetical protein ES707_11107 [subsurface metagenome]